MTDATGALVPGAEVKIDGTDSVKSDSAGHYIFSCVAPGNRVLSVTATGFASQTATVALRRGQTVRLNLKLTLEEVSSQIEVQARSTEGDPGAGVGTTTLNTAQIQQLADDPDDFLRQLQLLGGNVGGSDGATVIVDGFRSAGTLPPKSAISSIRLNPDIFVPEYQSPPWRGATIEIFTKPGLDSYHGALFLTNSNGVFNATNPFSSTTTPAGKQRYGFELSGPLVRQRSDFSLSLEHRAIDEFNIVNAVSLDAQGNQTSVRDTVSAPKGSGSVRLAGTGRFRRATSRQSRSPRT
ncbi:carboxypeptidase-like regulatory domain-containing protein [Granulicella cerasi]|uniref:Carboxypeptidase-like regulatory domain-containing protein n=1 Tax=Granulicella cerasi TaxID=741063 RepID=A0ABW1Z7V0_9BACT